VVHVVRRHPADGFVKPAGAEKTRRNEESEKDQAIGKERSSIERALLVKGTAA
jgi:hypothetical protein